MRCLLFDNIPYLLFINDILTLSFSNHSLLQLNNDSYTALIDLNCFYTFKNYHFINLILPSDNITPQRVNKEPTAVIQVNGSFKIRIAAIIVRIGIK